MPVTPYKLRPVAPRVAYLTPGGIPVGEDGAVLEFDRWPPSTRCYASWDTIWQLVRDGHGEALLWNNEEIRWRHRRYDEPEWHGRPSDVGVIRLPLDDKPELVLASLRAWRDWLAAEGAGPLATTGGAAWSLLRATLTEPLWLRSGDTPPLKWTSGGRIQNGPAGAGRFDGAIAHYDLPAAYASTLGELRYGGRWSQVTGDPERWAAEGRACFVRAKVRVPDLLFGPLLRRPSRPGFLAARMQLEPQYPTGTRLQGVWTWQELEAAMEAGCRVERVLAVWVHAGGHECFAPWWSAVQRGRQLPGLAGLLAKATGNALWGRFAMDPRVAGERGVRSRNGKLTDRKLPRRGWCGSTDHALAETVAGRVRARLFVAMLAAGEDLLAAHTDGIWRKDGDAHAGLPAEHMTTWRRDKQARCLDLIEPMVLRWYPTGRGKPRVVFAGQPRVTAGEAFERAWAGRADSQ